MRMLLLISAVAVVIVTGIALYANSFLGRVRKKQTELEQTLRDRAETLRGLDERFRTPPGGPLAPGRFREWLAVRTSVALLMEGRFRERTDDTWFHQQETRIALLERLQRELERRKMSLAEYRAVTGRYKGLLALQEFDALRLDWARKTASGKHPKGLPLPAPARDAKPAERALLHANAEALRKSAGADLLLPLLDDIAADRLPPPRMR